MTEVKADETCSCGASISFTLNGAYAVTESKKMLTDWRANHKHVTRKEYVPYPSSPWKPYQPYWSTPSTTYSPTTTTTTSLMWPTGSKPDDGDDDPDMGVPAKAG